MSISSEATPKSSSSTFTKVSKRGDSLQIRPYHCKDPRRTAVHPHDPASWSRGGEANPSIPSEFSQSGYLQRAKSNFGTTPQRLPNLSQDPVVPHVLPGPQPGPLARGRRTGRRRCKEHCVALRRERLRILVGPQQRWSSVWATHIVAGEPFSLLPQAEEQDQETFDESGWPKLGRCWGPPLGVTSLPDHSPGKQRP